jgi:O-antigen/teichoic acid export membrane protein
MVTLPRLIEPLLGQSDSVSRPEIWAVCFTFVLYPSLHMAASAVHVYQGFSNSLLVSVASAVVVVSSALLLVPQFGVLGALFAHSATLLARIVAGFASLRHLRRINLSGAND